MTALWSTTMLYGTVAAQTTIVLNQPDTQVTDTTIRDGSFSNTNFDGQVLLTRASAEADWERRALLKFDTKNTIPQGSTITSATLTLTVRTGLGVAGQTRPVYAYRIPQPFQESEATWIIRQGSYRWSSPGGDTAERFGGASVTNVAGATVSFDVTALVQRSVNGDYDSRYTRIALLDAGGDAKESYREYYSSEDSSASRRPSLTVVVAASGAPVTPPPPTGGSTLRVMTWNIAQGYGTDGTSNIDRVVNWIVQINPHLISFNEIMKVSGNNQPQMIADKLRARTGQTWTYHWVQKSGASSGEGEAVLSRLPIDAVASHLLSYDRSVAGVRVVVNGRSINMFSTHLDHQSSTRRLAQVIELKSWAATFPEQRIVAGDFNWYPGTTEINEMTETYKDAWVIAKSKGTATSYAGNPEGYTRNNRIDYVFYSKTASALSVASAQVVDTRASQVSDHRPVVVNFIVN